MTTKTKTPKTVTLSASQARVLKAIPEGGTTRKKLASALSVEVKYVDEDLDSLLSVRLVACTQEEDAEVVWTLTKRGAKIASRNSRERKQGLRVPQVRILKALYNATDGLTRPQIAVKAKVSLSMTGNLGPITTDDFVAMNRQYDKSSLYSLGYAKPQLDEEHGVLSVITAKGKKAYERLKESGIVK